MKRKDFVRLELQVPSDDAALLRRVARALGDSKHAKEIRILMQNHFARRRIKGLKALLAAAPFEGLDLERARDTGRPDRLGDS